MRAFGLAWESGWCKIVDGTLKTMNPNGTWNMEITYPEGLAPDKAIVHPKQCRRLRPRAKPKEERVERFVCRTNGEAGTLSFCTRAALERAYPGTVKEEVVRLVECPPGSVVVSREKLAEAWNDNAGTVGTPGFDEEHFVRFCKAIGLQKEEA